MLKHKLDLLLTSGYAREHVTEIAKVCNADLFANLPDVEETPDGWKRSSEQEQAFQRMVQLIEKRYLGECVFKRVNADIWSGSDRGTLRFHNDGVEFQRVAKSAPGWFFITILVYFSDMDETTGGALHVKHISEENAHVVFPKKYDVVLMSQENNFEHRTTPNTKQRVVAGLDYAVRFL